MDGKARSDQGSRPAVGLVQRYRRRNFARKQQGYEGGCTWRYKVPQLHASSLKRPSMPLVELMADGRMGDWGRGFHDGLAGGWVWTGLMMEGWRGWSWRAGLCVLGPLPKPTSHLHVRKSKIEAAQWHQ